MSVPGEPMESVALGDMLCFSVYAASHAFTRFYKPLLDPLGLTYPQFLVLVALGEKDSQTVGQIGARLLLESGTLTPLLKRLEGAGLITRQRDGRDERQVRAVLTEAGRALCERARDVHACVVAQVNREPDQLRALKADIDALRRSLDAALLAA